MIMDPGIDGLETYARILAIHPHQKAIILSGYAETDRVREAQALGAGEFVRKPYVLEKIGLAVRRGTGQGIGVVVGNTTTDHRRMPVQGRRSLALPSQSSSYNSRNKVIIRTIITYTFLPFLFRRIRITSVYLHKERNRS